MAVQQGPDNSILGDRRFRELAIDCIDTPAAVKNDGLHVRDDLLVIFRERAQAGGVGEVGDEEFVKATLAIVTPRLICDGRDIELFEAKQPDPLERLAISCRCASAFVMSPLASFSATRIFFFSSRIFRRF